MFACVCVFVCERDVSVCGGGGGAVWCGGTVSGPCCVHVGLREAYVDTHIDTHVCAHTHRRCEDGVGMENKLV